jgi:predicted Zn-dependent peptidase
MMATGTIGHTVLPNGIQVLTETMPQVRTAAVGIWIGTGSRSEDDRLAGISHFLEHMFFKGTHTRSALEIAQAADAIGAQMNAFTDREATVLYAKALSNHLPTVMALMADMLLQSALAPEALERERQVILEEIKMYEDSPDELVQDLFAQTIWNGHPLGRPVIGTVETVRSLRREDFLVYQDRRYRPNSVIVAVAGDVTHEAVVALVAAALGRWEGKAPPLEAEAPTPRPDILLRSKETEQVHLTLGVRGLPQADESRYVIAILDNILGGGMSSRLFQEIREKRGLVYTITSYHAAYREGGLFVIYGAMSPSAAPQVARLILEEIEKIRGGISDAELQRAKESYKGAIMLSLESTGSRMYKLARSQLAYGRQVSLDELLSRIDAVTAAQVQAMARALLVPEQMAMAAIGPFRGDGDLARDLRAAFRAEGVLTVG